MIFWAPKWSKIISKSMFKSNYHPETRRPNGPACRKASPTIQLVCSLHVITLASWGESLQSNSRTEPSTQPAASKNPPIQEKVNTATITYSLESGTWVIWSQTRHGWAVGSRGKVVDPFLCFNIPEPNYSRGQITGHCESFLFLLPCNDQPSHSYVIFSDLLEWKMYIFLILPFWCRRWCVLVGVVIGSVKACQDVTRVASLVYPKTFFQILMVPSSAPTSSSGRASASFSKLIQEIFAPFVFLLEQ